MRGLDGQFVILAIAFILWVIGIMRQARREREAREGREAQDDGDVVMPPARSDSSPAGVLERMFREVLGETDEADAASGPATAPPPAPPVRGPLVRTPPAPPPAAPAEPAPPRDEPLVAPGIRSVAAPLRAFGAGAIAGKQPAQQRARRERRRRTLARLGARPGTSGRTLTGRGVLWAEVLGPPRALRGPHRPPQMRSGGTRAHR